MNQRPDPESYEAWYATRRGAWMAEAEARALIRLGGIGQGINLLDAGCGTGWFTRRFAATGCAATGMDLDPEMLRFAREQDGKASYLPGDMLALPATDKSFDVVTAVTSLCFVRDERKALGEMIRVARRAVVLGLLHRHSLLYRKKAGKGAYAGAHWHARAEVADLVRSFPEIRDHAMETLLFWPGGSAVGRALERLPWLASHYGGFMAVCLKLRGNSE